MSRTTAERTLEFKSGHNDRKSRSVRTLARKQRIFAHRLQLFPLKQDSDNEMVRGSRRASRAW